MAVGEQNEFIPYYIKCAEKQSLVGRKKYFVVKINKVTVKECYGWSSISILCRVPDFVWVYKQRRELNFRSLLCDSGAIRTLDPRLRRALLYPAELRNQPYFCFCVGKGSAFLW